MKPLLLIGGGGHCKACIDVIEQTRMYQIAGIIDFPEKLHQKNLGYEIIGSDDDLPHLIKKYKNCLITIGQIKSPEKRIKIYNKIKELGATLPAIISPLAYVSKHATIGEGAIIMHHALINADVKIGKNCIVNSKALVEHDAQVADHCHLAPASVLSGGTSVGQGVFLGSNSFSREYISIGARSLIGGGVSVLQNILPGSIVKATKSIN